MDDKPIITAVAQEFDHAPNRPSALSAIKQFWHLYADWQCGLWVIIAMSGIALLVALIAQYGFGYPPCVLCLWQRVPYVACIAIGLCGTLLPQLWPWRGALLLLCALLLLGNAGVAYFHHGVEEGWWAGTAGCAIQAAADPAANSASALRMALLAQPVARCDVIGWSMLGVSITLWNVAYATLGAIIAILFALLARPDGVTNAEKSIS